ncbi:MAG: MopE-related protein, partial [Nanoarchaeota archaeon]
TNDACSAPSGFVADHTDCDDTSSAVNPNKAEVCNSVDDNCDGSIDEELSAETTCGIGACSSIGMLQCLDGDEVDGCVPLEPFIEVCNNIDDDCNGETDEAATDCTIYYRDEDRDGYGVTSDFSCICEPLGVYDTQLGGDGDDTDAQVNLINVKDPTKYDDKEVFLISDSDWRDIMSLVPVTTWTINADQECPSSMNELSSEYINNPNKKVCGYPTLIYHEEDNNFDLDSIIYFMQNYGVNKATIISDNFESNCEDLIDNDGDGLIDLSVVDAEGNVITQGDSDCSILQILELNSESYGEGGGDLSSDQINLISVNDYLSYWEDYSTVVYVENNYESVLLASTYASLINVPLIIDGMEYGNALGGKSIICIGDSNPSGVECSELDSFDENNDNVYQLEELRERYTAETMTDKLVLVSPGDLLDYVNGELITEKSGTLNKLYAGTSLASPFLAAGKHELIISTNEHEKGAIDSFVETFLDNNQEILDNAYGPTTQPFCHTSFNPIQGYNPTNYHYLNLDSGTGGMIPSDCYDGDNYITDLDNGLILFFKYNERHLQLFDLDAGNFLPSLYEDIGAMISPIKFDNEIIYSAILSNPFRQGFFGYDLNTGEQRTLILDHFSWKLKDFDGNNLVYLDDNYGLWLYKMDASEVIQLPERAYYYDNIQIVDDTVYWRYGYPSSQLHSYSISGGNHEILTFDTVSSFYIDGDNIVYTNIYHNLILYNFQTQEKQELHPLGYNPRISGNIIIFDDGSDVYMCDLTLNGHIGGCLENDEKTLLAENAEAKELSDEYAVWKLRDPLSYEIKGYLTILASPLSIVNKEYVSDSFSDSLDQTHYADLNHDFYPDMAVGRITGMTLSDVSSNIARSLFYDHFMKTNNIRFIASSSSLETRWATEFAQRFSEISYNSQSITDEEVYHSFDDYDYADQDTILYMDHGSDTWAGVNSLTLKNYWAKFGITNQPFFPIVQNTLLLSEACLTCSREYEFSYCYSVIRNGAIAHIGAVSQSNGVDDNWRDTLNNLYYSDLPLGQAFALDYADVNTFTDNLIGDPTLKLNPPYLLSEPLLWEGDI